MEWVENSFLPWILLTSSIATSCVNKASPRFSSWIWMDPLWSNLTLCLLYHLGLKQVTDPQHPGLQDGKQRQKNPGLCGHFWFKVRIMELLTWSVRLWGLALILFNIDVFFYDCYVSYSVFLSWFAWCRPKRGWFRTMDRAVCPNTDNTDWRLRFKVNGLLRKQ